MLARQLLPDPVDEVDTLRVYAPPDGRHLRVNMVASVDGAAAVEGRVGLLSGAADQVLLHELRAMADVLLVGAGTVRAEGYAPLDRPLLAVLSGRLDLPLDGPLFSDPHHRPLLITTTRAPRRDQAAEVADLLVYDGDRVDLRWAVDALAERGLTRVLSEGGPHALHQLYASGLVDELCLAVAPFVTGGPGPRVTEGPLLHPVREQRLAGALEKDGFLFLRYQRQTSR